MASKRRKLGADVKSLLLMQTGFKCGNPNCRGIITLEIHHIVQVSDGGGNELENLLPLCPNCHALHHSGNIPQDAILVWKGLIDSLSNPARNMLDLLILLHREPEPVKQPGGNIHEINQIRTGIPFVFTGDSLPAIAGLINSGLLEIYDRTYNTTFSGGPSPHFKVKLTPKGNRLISSWLSGDPSGVNEVIFNSKKAE